MLKEIYHPNAYLANLRNVRPGLRTRTKILNALEKGSKDAKTIAGEAAVHYNAVMHHLKLLQSEGIVRRASGKPSIWTLTGAGQKRLVSTG
jgi:predicted transcriptional regulator